MANLITSAMLRKGTRKCRVCRQTKPIDEFIKDLNGRKWMPSDCLECERKRYVKRYKVVSSDSYIKRCKQKPELCEVCGNSKDKICYDHCHITELHRGWLCDGCNHILGLSIAILPNYIEDGYVMAAIISWDCLKTTLIDCAHWPSILRNSTDQKQYWVFSKLRKKKIWFYTYQSKT